MHTSLQKCPGCGATCEPFDGPTHGYFGESPGCWKTYGLVLAREYEDRNFWKVHRLTVDTYAAQHPFNKDRRNIQSVNIHLMALHGILDLGLPFDDIPPLLRTAASAFKDTFTFLEPPNSLGSISVNDVYTAATAAEHEEIVWKWARSVWSAWQPHHDSVKQLFQSTQALIK